METQGFACTKEQSPWENGGNLLVVIVKFLVIPVRIRSIYLRNCTFITGAMEQAGLSVGSCCRVLTYTHHPVGMLIRGCSHDSRCTSMQYLSTQCYSGTGLARWSRRPRPPLLLWVLRRLYEHAPIPCKLGNLPRKPACITSHTGPCKTTRLLLCTCQLPRSPICATVIHPIISFVEERVIMVPQVSALIIPTSSLPAGQYAFER